MTSTRPRFSRRELLAGGVAWAASALLPGALHAGPAPSYGGFAMGIQSFTLRKLPLESDPHTYDNAGTYRILVKVIDIFGNDTSQAFEVQVK